MSTLMPLLAAVKTVATQTTSLGAEIAGQANQNMLLMRSTTAGTNSTFGDGWSQNGNIAITGQPTGGFCSPSTNNFSYYFNTDGGITYFTLPTTSYTNLADFPFTVECFINLDVAASNNIIAAIGGTNDKGSWSLSTVANGDGSYSINWSGTTTTGTYSINHTWAAKLTPGAWYHICVQKANTDVLYLNINGTYVGSVTEPITTMTYSPTSGGTVTCWIGGVYPTGGFPGYLSNVRVVYNGNAYAIASNFSIPTGPLTTSVASGTVQVLTCCTPILGEVVHNLATASDGLAAPAVSNFGPFLSNKSMATATGSGYFDGNSALNPSGGSGEYWNSLQITSSGFAIGVWVYPTELNGNTNICSAWGSTTATQGFALGYNSNGTLQFTYTIGTTQTGVSGAGTYNLLSYQWNYVLFNRSGNTCDLFVNGKIDKTFTMSGSTVESGVNANIGGPIPSIGWNGVTGYMAEFQVSTASQHTAAFAISTIPFGGEAQGWAWVDVGPNSNGQFDIQGFTGGNIYDAAYQGNYYLTGDTKSVTAPTNFSGYCSVSFDGTGQVVVPYTVPGITAGSNGSFFTKQAYTVEFWCYPTQYLSNTVHGLFGQKTSVSTYSPAELTVNNGIVTLTNASSSTAIYSTVTSTSTLNLNQWNHVAVVRNGSYVGLYMNGTLQGVVNCNPYYNIEQFFYIGGNCSTYSTGYSPFIGYIQEFRVILSPQYTGTTYTVPTAVFATT
jgi:hypothetical protein